MFKRKEPDLSFDITYGKLGQCKIWIDGTDEWRDLKVTLRRFMPWWGTHGGVEQAAREVFAMLDYAGVLSDEAMTYYIGGHSMGGAIAVAVGDLMWQNNYTVKEVMTYGAYGTGLKPQCKVQHYRNKHDIVPFIFPWWIPKAHRIKCDRKLKWPTRFVTAHKYYKREAWKII